MINRLFSRLAVTGALCASCAATQALDLRTGVPEGDVEVYFNVLVETPLDPANEFAFIDLVPFNDGTGRLAVSTIQGGVRVIDGSGQLNPTSLLTKAQTQLVLPQESGMTGIVFHPDFNDPETFGYGKLYTITTEAPENDGGLGDASVDYPFHNGSNNEEHQGVVLEWDLAAFGNVPGNAGNNQFTGVYANAREILRIDEPGPFHNVFDLAFNTSVGPGDDDYGILYVTAGDGGDRTGYARATSAQDLSTIWGNILRIDPDPTGQALVRTSANSGQPAYSIPDDNPYNGDDATETKTSSTLAEIWARGVRSPWRLTFDRVNGDLYLGDVGENLWEEVDLIEKGKNYGWGYMEGFHDGTLIGGDGTLVPGLTLPIFELSHSDASRSISGGFVYRGSAIPELVGKYVFADLGQGFNSSAIFYAIVDPDDPDGNVGDVFEFKLNPSSPMFESGTQELPERIFSIGEDENGELYLIAGPDPRQPFNPNRPSLVIRLEPTFAFVFGDLSGDLDITSIDWMLFKAGQGMDFTGLTPEQTYPFGDLDGDLDHDLDDFWLFRTAYEDFNGMGSFAGLLSVPEPGSCVLLLIGGVVGVAMVRRRGLGFPQTGDPGKRSIRRAGMIALIRLGLVACLGCAGVAQAQITDIIVPNGDFEDYSLIGDGTSGAGWGSFPGAAGGLVANALPLDDEFFSNPSSFSVGWQSNGPQASNGKFGLQHTDDQYFQRDGSHNLTGAFDKNFIGFANLDSDDGAGAESGSTQSGILGQLLQGAYTLTVGVGGRDRVSNGDWNDVSYSISLVADNGGGGGPLVAGVGSSGGNVLGTPATRTEMPTVNGLGNNTHDLIYSLVLDSGDPRIGEDYAIRIDYMNAGTRGGAANPVSQFTQAAFDNVRLTFEGEFHPPFLSLRVDPISGRVQIENNTVGDVSFNAYRITSEGESLVPGSWNPISNQSLSGFPASGGDTGEGWEPAPNPLTSELVEWYLQGDSTLTMGDAIRLGKAFSTAVDAEQDLLFQYRLGNGNKITGEVIYAPIVGVAGDYNDNGVVDAADFTIWRDHLGQTFQLTNEDPENQDGQVTSADYAFWKAHFGETTPGSGAAATAIAASAVPEPSTEWLLAMSGCGLITAAGYGGESRRSRPRHLPRP